MSSAGKSRYMPVFISAVLFLFNSFTPVRGEPFTVFVSIAPQADFVERIGGERVDVHVLVQPGHSPATYDPTPRQMAALAEAVLYFRIGVPFENAFIPGLKKAIPGIRIVDTRTGIPLRVMKSPADRLSHPAQSHSHGEDHDDCEGAHHVHGGTDPHIWLSPSLVKIQAQTIAKALIELDTTGKGIYERNVSVFVDGLDSLHNRLQEILSPVSGKSFLVFHPSWGYFADAYGLEQVPIEMEGKQPSGRRLAEIMEMAGNEGIRAVFVQPQFSSASAEAVADAIGGDVIAIDPLARDYAENLLHVATVLREMLGKQR